jgi:hypothetical protein
MFLLLFHRLLLFSKQLMIAFNIYYIFFNMDCYIASGKVKFFCFPLVKTVSRAGPQNVMFGNRSAMKHLLTGQ